jgi:HEPN domain-containing protein
MKLIKIISRKRDRKVFTNNDCSVADLICYGVDHLAAAERLYQESSPSRWQYLHSVTYLSHLSIELLLKACLLELNGQFPSEHNLKRLFRPLQKKGLRLTSQGMKWLNQLSRSNELRYPDPKAALTVGLDDWTATKCLFNEIRECAPVEVQKQIMLSERYQSSVKGGKAINLTR